MRSHRLIKCMQLITVLLMLLLSVTLLVACDGGTDGNTESESQTESTTADYTVTVSDYKGQVPTVDVLIDLMQGDQIIASKRADAEGKAVFTQEKGDYTFTLSAAKGEFYYDTAACAFSAEVTSAKVTVYDTYKKTDTLYPAFGDDDERTEYEAAMVKEGATHVKIDKEGKGFYIFRPTRGGIYRFSYISAEKLTIGYFGEPMAMLAKSGANAEQVAQGYFEIEVKNFTPEQTGGSVTICIGLASDTATDAILVVERVGDPEKEIPSTTIQAKSLPSDFPKTDGQSLYLQDISVTDPSVKIHKGEDGFYHYGTVDGPVVYLRIKSDNRFIPSFAKMCETDGMGVPIRENGEIVLIEYYAGLFNDYAEIADENGLCPLTDELIDAILKVAGHKGWFNFESVTGILGADANGNSTGITADNLVVENAYLFACCYIENH